ncbi:hypothetical protein K450DRAFT_223655 [Umbelopsis ramanniana AG]|uniref:DUF4097 domain-containing protein n=1 Tax=Umbelopsis ramanniana AG TaxID=1314678 RepID=A0AAD5EGS1_UMBRA|nr:uncharacterized protein K450DRAFT_223655 [Umbelopsis ramanniana AG]KAI8583433.1 hypothetical protein K450DRAFT_223655 [Umbelopsis ramanniana AG]
MDEKTPILPPPAVSNCQCRCRSDNKKKRVFKRTVLFLVGLFALHVFSHRFQSFRSDWHNGVVSQQCHNGELPIQWEGKTSYDVDPAKFPNLSVLQNGSITGGFVKTFTQSDDDLAHINVNIHFSEDYLQDQINIIIDDSENGYNFTVETPKHLHRECINVEITIALPNSAQFNNLAITTINSKIELMDDILTQESISLQTVNGGIHAEYVKTIELVANTVNGRISIEKAEAQTVMFHSVNGAIHANVDAEKISTETINGSIHLENIGDRTAVAINTQTVNGSTYVSAPKNFEGAFSLKTILGKPEVFSQSESDKLHIEKAGRSAIEGYYDSRVENSYISSETRLGSITLKFD